MSELYSIPLACKEGVYSVFDFQQDTIGEDAVTFDYDTQYQMLTYDVPVGQEWRGMTLYSVPEKDIFGRCVPAMGRMEGFRRSRLC